MLRSSSVILLISLTSLLSVAAQAKTVKSKSIVYRTLGIETRILSPGPKQPSNSLYESSCAQKELQAIQQMLLDTSKSKNNSDFKMLKDAKAHFYIRSRSSDSVVKDGMPKISVKVLKKGSILSKKRKYANFLIEVVASNTNNTCTYFMADQLAAGIDSLRASWGGKGNVTTYLAQPKGEGFRAEAFHASTVRLEALPPVDPVTPVWPVAPVSKK